MEQHPRDPLKGAPGYTNEGFANMSIEPDAHLEDILGVSVILAIGEAMEASNVAMSRLIATRADNLRAESLREMEAAMRRLLTPERSRLSMRDIRAERATKVERSTAMTFVEQPKPSTTIAVADRSTFARRLDERDTGRETTMANDAMRYPRRVGYENHRPR